MKRLFAVLLLLLTVGPVLAATHSLSFGVPKPVPAMTFSDAEGNKVTLEHFRGQVVVLDFWASWCGPCRDEFPALDNLQGRYAAQGLVVLAVSVDRKGMPAVDRFYKELNVVHLGKYLDDTREMALAMGVRGLPTTMVIDRQGHEVARVEGPADWEGPEMAAVLERLLQ